MCVPLMFAPCKKSSVQPRQHIKKHRHYFASKRPCSQSYGFSSSHAWCESQTIKNWCCDHGVTESQTRLSDWNELNIPDMIINTTYNMNIIIVILWKRPRKLKHSILQNNIINYEINNRLVTMQLVFQHKLLWI